MEANLVAFRAITAADRGFLEDMLLEAVNWDPGRQPLDRDTVLTDPRTNKYVADWPREGDSGVIALGSSGEPIGAAWLRYFTKDDPGYGYVADDVPELSIGVVPEWRGKGVGRSLIRAVMAAAGKASLSVERANPAQQLYRQEGFRTVASGETADTMLRD